MSPREISWGSSISETGYWPLDDRYREVLNFIEEYIDDHGYAPSMRDIVKATDLSSTSSVVYALAVLEQEGRISRDRRVARSIRVCE